jgi:hypothetical protein
MHRTQLEWMDRANCGPATTKRTIPTVDPKATAKERAAAVCDACPVTKQCLEFGMAANPDPNVKTGTVWAGMDDREVRNARRRRSRAGQPVVLLDTERRYVATNRQQS